MIADSMGHEPFPTPAHRVPPALGEGAIAAPRLSGATKRGTRAGGGLADARPWGGIGGGVSPNPMFNWMFN
jgi:hypothetical protein